MQQDILDDPDLDDDTREKITKSIADAILEQEQVTLTTVGIDIGSSTSHLLFAKIVLQRETQALSSRFVVVQRDVIWRSPIMLTPFTAEGSIDAEKLGVFIREAYASAGLKPTDIDSGAVILTGEAIKKRNARAIDELFADEAGKFVCATAGHQLEATLAAHGSGAVRLSKERGECILHVDIGGGTTKLALIEKGRIHSVAAFAVGGRLIARNGDGSWSRIDDSAKLAADDLKVPATPQAFGDEAARVQIARRLASVLYDYVMDEKRDSLGTSLLLTEELERPSKPTALTFSGGVSEYVFGREDQDFGDIAKPLAQALLQELATRSKLPILDPGAGIRATVIGASQFTVQVSGKTIFISNPEILPLRNVPVVHLPVPEELTSDAVAEGVRRGLLRTDLSPDAQLALAIEWSRDPEYRDLLTFCRGVVQALAPTGKPRKPLVMLIDGDIGKTIGHLLSEEVNWPGALVSIDGVRLNELDFVDVGQLMTPPGVVPLVIKSLVFSEPT